ncbi:hypothetical protein [Halodesulfovibrio spirochaetisodalis]|uniref:Lipoprotein n=1 Tax=Halodesulfovibrio spirochaetisodalis TaxID=1560234 RepID=A0A1B7XID0_9BACT|nr:hypothetical protein [Halodesulfovibrio spirochaetisodalis]OBQ55249.1 hypothetical protein SP90_04665 [Halodesulfovibrio spirochaetisodalis]
MRKILVMCLLVSSLGLLGCAANRMNTPSGLPEASINAPLGNVQEALITLMLEDDYVLESKSRNSMLFKRSAMSSFVPALYSVLTQKENLVLKVAYRFTPLDEGYLTTVNLREEYIDKRGEFRIKDSTAGKGAEKYQKRLDQAKKIAEKAVVNSLNKQSVKSYLFSFRKTNWGMTKQEVKQSETANLVTELGDALMFEDYLLQREYEIIYVFVKNKLVRAKYVLKDKYSNENMYLFAYREMSNVLTKKYGTPIGDEKFWSNSLYKDDIEKHGFAVSIGHLLQYQEWVLPETDISLNMQGNNYEVRCAVEYKSTKFRSLEEALEEKKNMDAF